MFNEKQHAIEYYAKRLQETNIKANQFNKKLWNHEELNTYDLVVFRNLETERIALIELLNKALEMSEPAPKKTWKFWKK